MNPWYAALALLAVMQIWFYKIEIRKLISCSIFYWGAVYLALLGCEFVKKILVESEIYWWVSVSSCLIAVTIGETAEVLAASVGKSVDKKRQSLPSFYSFSALFLTLVWLGLRHQPLLYQSQIEMLVVATFSFFFLAILAGIHERLDLYDAPRYLRGLPILAISAALFLLVFLR